MYQHQIDSTLDAGHVPISKVQRNRILPRVNSTDGILEELVTPEVSRNLWRWSLLRLQLMDFWEKTKCTFTSRRGTGSSQPTAWCWHQPGPIDAQWEKNSTEQRVNFSDVEKVVLFRYWHLDPLDKKVFVLLQQQELAEHNVCLKHQTLSHQESPQQHIM